MMEPIGEILKKMQTRINSSGENTDIWSSDEKEPGPVGDKNCPICKGGGFVHPRLPSGKPDYSRVVSCRCIKAAQAKAQGDRLQKYSNLGILAGYSFEKIAENGLSGDAGSRELFKKAF